MESVTQYKAIHRPPRSFKIGTHWPQIEESKHLTLKYCSSRTVRIFENRVLKRIFGPKRDEVTGEWRRQGTLCSVFLTKYHLVDQIKKSEMGRARNTYGERRGAYGFLVGNPKGKRPF
jgi:hypothetical protein